MIQKYGISSEHPLSPLELELIAFRLGLTLEQGGLGKPEHFWNICELLWGSGLIRHPWAERCAELASEHQYLAVHGCGSCVRGDTRILNPVTGEQPTIKELAESRSFPVVMTVDGPAVAGIPFLKGRERLVRLELQNGHVCYCTPGHRVLVGQEFVPVSSLRCGQSISGYVPFQNHSTSGTSPSVHVASVQSSLKIAVGSQDDYHSLPRFYDAQLLQGVDTCQSSVPSQACVPAYKGYASGHSGDPENKSQYSHPYSPKVSVSTPCNSDPLNNSETLALRRFSGGTLSHVSRLFQLPYQSGQGRHLWNSIQKLNHDFFHKHSLVGYKVSDVVVQGISYTEEEDYYDMQVPVHNHYYAEGIIHHNSGKSEIYAAWGIVNWLSDPDNTLVLYTSTDLKSSKLRIWGSVKKLFLQAKDLPGRMIDSLGWIKTTDAAGNCNNDKAGLILLAGDRKKEKESIGKLIGLKNKRVFLIADELPELSEALIEAALSNLALNPMFQMVGIGNFNSIYDPLGVFARPKQGYGSITVEDEEWETELGYCLRLDGMKSPAVLGDPSDYPNWLYNRSKLEAHQKTLGEKSARFWRMCRSFPCPEAEANCIYSDADFIKGDCMGRVAWLDEPVSVMAADPSFTTDGDNFSVAKAKFGRNRDGIPTLQFEGIKYLHENMEITAAGEARDLQMARQLAKEAEDFRVAKANLGTDCSGPGGLAFGSILSIYWGSQFLAIKFAERASDRPVSEIDPKKCSEAYNNRASELWFQGREFIRSGQIKGLPAEVAKELKSRYYSTTKSGDGLKIKIEPKKDMKARIGFSPDAADAALMLIFLCCERFGFTAGGQSRAASERNSSWTTRAQKVNSVYDLEDAYAAA